MSWSLRDLARSELESVILVPLSAMALTCHGPVQYKSSRTAYERRVTAYLSSTPLRRGELERGAASYAVDGVNPRGYTLGTRHPEAETRHNERE